MSNNCLVCRVLKTFSCLSVGIASMSAINYLATKNVTLAVLNPLQLQNTTQLDSSKGKSNSKNLQVAQTPSITRTINGAEVTAYPLYRYYASSSVDHFYTVNFDEIGNGKDGYTLEGTAAYISTQQYSGTIPLYRYFSSTGTDHFYTTDFAELGNGKSGYVLEGIAGYIYPVPTTGTMPLYRYFSSTGTDHFYTTNFAELGGGRNEYVFEGIAGYVLTNQ